MILEGKKYEDQRGIVTYNNEFDTTEVKRIYTIENYKVDYVRGWQGHKIEQRWFAAIRGKFQISVIKIDDFNNPSKDLKIEKYELDDEYLTYLHVPSGYITSIQSLEPNSKLLVLADHFLGEVQDEYRFSPDYFINE